MCQQDVKVGCGVDGRDEVIRYVVSGKIRIACEVFPRASGYWTWGLHLLYIRWTEATKELLKSLQLSEFAFESLRSLIISHTLLFTQNVFILFIQELGPVALWRKGREFENCAVH